MGRVEQWDPSTGRVPGQGVESNLTGKKRGFSSVSFYGQVTLRVKVPSVDKKHFRKQLFELMVPL